MATPTPSIAQTAANIAAAMPSNTAQAALDVVLTGEEISLFELTLNDSPANIQAKLAAVIAARVAKINADTDAAATNPTQSNEDKVREDNS